MSQGFVIEKFENTLVEQIQFNGEYEGRTAYVFNIFGRRAGFTSTSALNDVKEFDNGVALCPTLSASTLDIISSSVNDTNAAGTGARKVKVTYIDNSNNIVQSAAINLNGTTLVTSVLTNVNEVLWMEVTDAGSGGVAAGNIRLRINGGTVEVEQISAQSNRSMSARFMVPTGYKGYLYSWNCQSANNDQDVRLRALADNYDRSIATVFHYQATKLVASNTNSGDLKLPMIQLPALCKVRVATMSAGTSATVNCESSVQIIIIAD